MYLMVKSITEINDHFEKGTKLDKKKKKKFKAQKNQNENNFET